MCKQEEQIESYKTLTDKNGDITLFVNSWEKPHRETPLDHYHYYKTGNEYDFFRLYRVTWLKDGLVEYSIYDWRPVEIKNHCVAAMKQLIDSMRAAEEFVKK